LTTDSQNASIGSAFAVYFERRALVMLALGFAAGLPYFLVFDTLSAWLRSAGLSLEVIGFFSLVTMISSFKFLWAPLVDRLPIPLLSTWLGHRRSWMLACQVLVMLGLWLVSGSDPSRSLGMVAMFAVLVGFSSATQDIAIDAWRIDAAEMSRQGAMAAAYTWGYRGAMVIAGAVPLLLSATYGWNFAYAAMAALMAVGVVGVLAAPREGRHVVHAIDTVGIRVAPALEALEWLARLAIIVVGALLLGSGLAANAGVFAGVLRALGAARAADALLAAWASNARAWLHFLAVVAGFGIVVLAALPIPNVRTRPGAFLSAALVDPLRDFFVRHRSTGLLILALICVYRIPDFVLTVMNPFYLDLGYSVVEIAEVRKIFGVLMTMGGVFAGGLAVARYGPMPGMVIGAFAGALSNLLFVWLATQDHNLWSLFAAIGLDNVAGGFAATCLIAYMSSLTGAGFTATQYALFSSLYAIPGRLLASQSGRIVESAARSADSGGTLSYLNGLFANLGPGSFATALERSGVSPAALGTGYVVFFTYTALTGLLGIVLAIVVWRRERRSTHEVEAVPPRLRVG
jgi:MFS transporter, PAT family, beta-lactamase induction signal transducer AmpG